MDGSDADALPSGAAETRLPRRTWMTLSEAVGTATLFVSPFWMAAFAGIRTPFDGPYVGNLYHSPLGFVHVEYIAAILVTLLLAILLWLLVYKEGPDSPFRRKVGGLLSVLSICLFLNGVRIHWLSWWDLDWAVRFYWISVPLAAVAVFVAWRYRGSIGKLAVRTARAASVLFLVFLANATVAVVRLEPESLFAYSLPAASPAQDRGSVQRRVVWIIFDELDERVGFEDRPSTVRMPALDRFRNEATVATKAVAPGDVTLYSMPTLFTGRYVDTADHISQDDLLLHFRSGEKARWSRQPGIFRFAREHGFNVALLAEGGHPYCRLFVRYLAYCMENRRVFSAVDRNLLTGAAAILRSVRDHIPLVQRLSGVARQSFGNSLAHQYEQFSESVGHVLADPAYDLVVLHWNLPHWPYFYDHTNDRFLAPGRFGQNSVEGYLGNLELTDRAFASMRETLQAASLWENSAIIVSADHRWRQAERLDGKRSRYVPLMIKLPGQKQAHRIGQDAFAVNSSRLVQGLLTGTVASVDAVAKVLVATD